MAKTNIQRKSAAIQSLFPQQAAAEQLTLFAQAILDAAAQKPVVVEEEKTRKSVSVATGWKPSKELKKAVKAYRKARAQEKAATQEKARQADIIKAEFDAAGLSDVEEFFGDDFKIIFAEVETIRVKASELKERLPEIYATFSETHTTRPLKIN